MNARRIVGAIIVVLGAVGVTASAYLNWIEDQVTWSEPENMPISSLYETSLGETASSYWTSVAVPLAAVTLIALVGALLRSRVVLNVALVVGLATVALWVVMRLLDDTAGLAFADLESGFWVGLLGLAVMVIGIVSMGAAPTRPADSSAAESRAAEADLDETRWNETRWDEGLREPGPDVPGLPRRDINR